MKIREVKSVEDDAGGVGERVGFDDVHAPGSEHARDVGEEAGTVGGEKGERETVAFGFEFGLQGRVAKLAVESEMVSDFRGRVDGEIAPGETFEEAFDFGARRSLG